jgi:hypothetical protein
MLKVKGRAKQWHLFTSPISTFSCRYIMGYNADVSSHVDAATDIIQSNDELKKTPKKWYYHLWDTLDKPKEERRFMFKLDAALLTLLHQVSRPIEHQQRFRIWNVGCDYPYTVQALT